MTRYSVLLSKPSFTPTGNVTIFELLTDVQCMHTYSCSMQTGVKAVTALHGEWKAEPASCPMIRSSLYTHLENQLLLADK